MSDDLVKRLRDSATFISDSYPDRDAYGGYSNLRHAAADRIEDLTAELTEARKVLERIADRDITWTVGTAFDSVKDMARAFLSRHPEPQERAPAR